MFVKVEIIRWVISCIFMLIALYSGISCIASFHRARTQPYLKAGTERFDFSGYFILAFINAAVCLLTVIVSVILVI